MRNRIICLNFILLVVIWVLLVMPATTLGATNNAKRSQAVIKYVSDSLAITMRSGKSNEHRIIRSLESGSKLRVLETDKDYTQVKTETGETGWVLTRFLMDEPAARSQLPDLQEKLSKLETEHADLRTKFRELSKERNELAVVAGKYEKLDLQHKKLSDEAAHLRKISSESEQLFKEKETLTRNVAILTAEKNVLIDEIKELRNGNNKLWFITGAGVIFIGILIGAMLSRGRKQKTSSWGAGPDTLMLRQP